jgi:hypothetical protein
VGEPLLNLDTLIVRPTIGIDGTKYEILSPDELSVLDSQRFSLWGQEIERLGKDSEKGEELAALIDKVARKVLVGVPDEVFAKLTGSHKLSVVEVFTMLLLRRKAGVVGAITAGLVPLKKSTGAKSSLASSVSTEAIRAGGSNRPQQDS